VTCCLRWRRLNGRRCNDAPAGVPGAEFVAELAAHAGAAPVVTAGVWHGRLSLAFDGRPLDLPVRMEFAGDVVRGTIDLPAGTEWAERSAALLRDWDVMTGDPLYRMDWVRLSRAGAVEGRSDIRLCLPPRRGVNSREPIKVTVDGVPLGSGSFARGIELNCTLEPGGHLLGLSFENGALNVFRQWFTLSVEGGGRYGVRLAWDGWRGCFRAQPEG
jgi:hypothetical protein